MATVVRQPFAPLDGARLQNLTSIKNRQNVVAANSPVKRKASDLLDADDFENVDPTFYSKRSKGVDADNFPAKEKIKSPFVLTKVASAPALSKETLSPVKPQPRVLLEPKSPAAKLNTSVAKSSPLSAPAGRSPTRGSKRIGILSSRRRTGGPFGRVDPPSFAIGLATPFSLDAALRGTIPSYSGRTSSSFSSTNVNSLLEPDVKSSWNFDIHEDTPEQEMTNLLQHGTCTLDISSDEETEVKAHRERAEGRDKENIPPADDVSQTSSVARRGTLAATEDDDMVVEKPRGPLVEMDPADYYPEGCDSTSVIIIPEDEDGETPDEAQIASASAADALAPQTADTFDFEPEQKPGSVISVAALVGKDERARKAAVLEPMEGTGESFELWESSSAKDEAEPRTRDGTPSPDAYVGPQEQQ